MNLTLLLMPLIGGYVFLSSWNFTKFKTISDSGYRLFFKSAFFGVILLIVSNLILSTVNGSMAVESIRKFVVPIGFELESVLALVLGWVLPIALNFFSNADFHSKEEAKNRGDQLFLAVRESLLDVELVELSMANGKVYIGFPVGMHLNDEYVKIDPYASGYRDLKTKVLRITLKYEAIDYKASEEKKLYVSLKVAEVISVRIFHPEVFSQNVVE